MLDIILTDKGLQVSEFGNIRITQDGWLSVYDLIRVCSESKDRKYPHKVWERMSSKYFRGALECSYFKFTGRGQKKTPIIPYKNALQIISLLNNPKADAIEILCQKLNLPYSNLYIKPLSANKESINTILQFFSNLHVVAEYNIANYRIDIYFPAHRLAIECDEYGHKNYNSKQESERESFIANALECDFIRYDPYNKNFNIFELLKEINYRINNIPLGISLEEYLTIDDFKLAVVKASHLILEAYLKKNPSIKPESTCVGTWIGEKVKDLADEIGL
ncbi:MAG: hypothetical protein ACRC80_31280 [Waterburya sp.]